MPELADATVEEMSADEQEQAAEAAVDAGKSVAAYTQTSPLSG